MVMHPHTKYHWPISKETIIWPWGQRSRSKQTSLWYETHLLWSCTHIPNIIDLSRKKQLFDLQVKCQGPTMVITVRNTLPYGHSPTYQISLTCLERQKWHGPDKKILFKKRLFDHEVKDQGPTKVIMVHDTPHYGHAQASCMGPNLLI
jgi:hypothetical protein